MNRNVWVVDRRTRERVMERVVASGLMNWLFSSNYTQKSSSVASWIARLPAFSRLVGWLARRPFSARFISSFIQRYSVQIQDFQPPLNGWPHFEAFFSRSLRAQARSIDNNRFSAVVPADGRYSLFDPLDARSRLWVRGRSFSLEQLLGQHASRYQLAPVCLARLCPSDYHRFHSPIEGKITHIEHTPGPLFSVHPWSLSQNFGRLLENRRVLIEIENPLLGSCLLIAVGATCVGTLDLAVSIGDNVAKGQEIGTFHLGGSSVLLIMQPGLWEWSYDLLTLIEQHDARLEILCQMGQPLALHQTSTTRQSAK